MASVVATSIATTTVPLPSKEAKESSSRGSSSAASSKRPSSKSPTGSPRLKRHKHYYLSEGNIVIQVDNTLFRVDLSVLHENSPIIRTIVPPVQSGKLPLVGYNDKRPLQLREVREVDFVRLLTLLYPIESKTLKKLSTVDEMLSVLKLATSFQMENVRKMAVARLHELPIDPVRRIAIWDEFHLDSELLLPAYAELCQRSEPLTLPMTMSLGLRNFTKVAASRDLYRQRVGCCGCRKSLSVEESQKIANEIVQAIFTKRPPRLDKPLL